jgi:hypothetical protein
VHHSAAAIRALPLPGKAQRSPTSAVSRAGAPCSSVSFSAAQKRDATSIDTQPPSAPVLPTRVTAAWRRPANPQMVELTATPYQPCYL